MDDEDFKRRYPALWARHQKKLAKRRKGKKPPPPPTKRGGIKSSGPADRHGKPWTKEETDYLEYYWGTRSIERICDDLRRAHPGVVAKASALGLGSMNRGKYSLSALEKETGYDRGRILTAARRLFGKRTPRAKSRRGTPKKNKGRHYAFNLDQVELIMEELAKHPDGSRLWKTHFHEWGGKFRNGAKKPKQCLGCGKSDVSHYSRGRCRPCHDLHTGRTKRRRIPRDVWEGRNPPHCKTCGTTEAPHLAKNQCRRCYQRKRDVVGLGSSDDS